MGSPNDLADGLEGVIAGADPALMDDEIDAIGAAIDYLRMEDAPDREPDIRLWVNREKQQSDQRALLSWVEADGHPTVEHIETAEGFREAIAR